MQYIWLFPILFIFHDFEEIIFMRAWINKNRSFLRGRFPVLAPKMFAHFDPITTSAFALGVAEEFLSAHLPLYHLSVFTDNAYNDYHKLFDFMPYYYGYKYCNPF